MSSQRWPLAEDLDALDEAGGVGRGRGQRVGAVLTRKAILMDSGSMKDVPLVSDAADPRGCGGERAQRAREVLRVKEQNRLDFFLGSLDVSCQLVEAGRRQAPA